MSALSGGPYSLIFKELNRYINTSRNYAKVLSGNIFSLLHIIEAYLLILFLGFLLFLDCQGLFEALFPNHLYF
jgi:hypothetical protein